MQVLTKEKKVLFTEINSNISELDKNKILKSQNNYLKSWKSYSINEAYKIWLSKLTF